MPTPHENAITETIEKHAKELVKRHLVSIIAETPHKRDKTNVVLDGDEKERLIVEARQYFKKVAETAPVSGSLVMVYNRFSNLPENTQNRLCETATIGIVNAINKRAKHDALGFQTPQQITWGSRIHAIA